jgi:hypothetical protein
MQLRDYQIAEQFHQLLEGLGDEAMGLLVAVEGKLTAVAAPDISWEMQSVDTGLLRSLAGKRRDFLVIEHRKFKEYRILISARAYGTVLQASWLLVAAPRFSNEVVRAMRLTADAKGRHDIGAELDTLAMMDLNAFVGITRLALRRAVAELTKDNERGAEADTLMYQE